VESGWQIKAIGYKLFAAGRVDNRGDPLSLIDPV